MQTKELIAHFFALLLFFLLFPVLSTAQNAEPTPALKIYRGSIADLQVKAMDYLQFMDRVRDRKPSYDVLFWGWMMDYPDPENFLFLLHGPNSTKSNESGSNYARYANPRYDELFNAMETMTNDASKEVTYTDIKSGEQKTEVLTRLQIIRKMREVFEHDMPWIPLSHDQSYVLGHRWVHNAKAHPMTGPWLKYINIDTEERAKQRAAWRE